MDNHGTTAWLAPRALALALSLCPALSHAQDAERQTPVASMTLDDALAYARAHHATLRTDRARVALAESRARVPSAAWLPRVGATLQATYGTNNNSATNWLGSGGAVEFPRIAGTGFLQSPDEINWRPYLSTAVGVGVEQRVFDFGRIAAERAVVDAELDARRARGEVDRLRVDLAVREAFFAVLAARSVLSAAEGALSRATVHRDEARARAERGLRPAVDVERADADVARFELARTRAEGGLRAAQTTFAAVLDLPGQMDVRGEPPPAGELPSRQRALRLAEERDPALREARARVVAEGARVDSARAELRPEVALLGTVMSAAGGAPRERIQDTTFGTGTVPWIPNYFVGLVLRWRIFDGVARARVETAQRAEEVARAEETEARREGAAQVEEAWNAADLAVRALPALERMVAAARANYAAVEARGRVGLGTSVELADAELLRTEAEIQLALGHFDVARTRARLARSIAEGT